MGILETHHYDGLIQIVEGAISTVDMPYQPLEGVEKKTVQRFARVHVLTMRRLCMSTTVGQRQSPTKFPVLFLQFAKFNFI